MLATVFAMQSLGQLFAACITVATVNSGVGEDTMWRWIYGAGAIPAAVVLLFRISIPESPRYTFDVRRNPKQANNDVEFVSNNSLSGKSNIKENTRLFHTGGPQQAWSRNNDDPQQALHQSTATPEFPPLPSKSDARKYFLVEGNWRHLFATAGTWFLLDLAFYGLGLNTPQIVSGLYNAPAELAANFNLSNCPLPYNQASPSNESTPIWCSEPSKDPLSNFRDNATHFMMIVSTGAVSGSLILIWLVNHVSRKRLQVFGFSLLGVFFLIIGGLLSTSTLEKSSDIAIVAMYAVCQFLFNLGMTLVLRLV